MQELLQQGQNELDRNNNVSALLKLQEAMNMAKEYKEDNIYFEAAVYIALIYDMTGQQKRAYELLKSLKYRESKSSSSYASQYYYRLMAHYFAIFAKDYKASKEYLQRVIELDKRLYPNDTSFIYSDLSNLAELYLIAGNETKAWEVVNKLRQSKPTSNRLYLAQLNYVHSSLLINQGLYDSAYHMANEGIKYAQLHKSPELEVLNRTALCRTDSARGNFKSFLSNKRMLEKLSDEISGKEINRKITTIEMQNKMEWMHNENERTKHFYIIGLVMLCIIIIALSIAIYYIRKNEKQKQRTARLERQKLDRELEIERLEKELLSLQIEKNEEKLDKAYQANADMSAILVELHDDMTPSEKLQNLEATLKQQYPDFIGTMKRTYPQLTYNDIRLIGFIRMGIQPQTIAAALHITMASLNTSRYRLRKKLNMKPDDDFNVFVRGL